LDAGKNKFKTPKFGTIEKKRKTENSHQGKTGRYSNSGYVLLVSSSRKSQENRTGEFLHEKLFAPLKMNHTLVFQKGKNEIVNRAFGHSKENDAFKETESERNFRDARRWRQSIPISKISQSGMTRCAITLC